MAPENAGILYVDDDLVSVEQNTEFLERAGHRVVEVATSKSEALKIIPELKKMGIM